MKHRAELAKIKASTNICPDNTYVPHETTYVEQQPTVQPMQTMQQPTVQQTTYVAQPMQTMEQQPTVQQTTYVSAEQSMEQATPQPTFVEQDPVIEQNQTPIETEEVVDNLEDSTQDAVEPVENEETTADLPEPEPNTTDEANNVTINIEDNNDNQEE